MWRTAADRAAIPGGIERVANLVEDDSLVSWAPFLVLWLALDQRVDKTNQDAQFHSRLDPRPISARTRLARHEVRQAGCR